jgi:hypothetical protein
MNIPLFILLSFFFFCFIMPSYAHLYPLKHLLTLTITRLFQVHSHTHTQKTKVTIHPLFMCAYFVLFFFYSHIKLIPFKKKVYFCTLPLSF